MSQSERVVIGMDPHKRSATIEVINIRLRAYTALTEAAERRLVP